MFKLKFTATLQLRITMDRKKKQLNEEIEGQEGKQKSEKIVEPQEDTVVIKIEITFNTNPAPEAVGEDIPQVQAPRRSLVTKKASCKSERNSHHNRCTSLNIIEIQEIQKHKEIRLLQSSVTHS